MRKRKLQTIAGTIFFTFIILFLLPCTYVVAAVIYIDETIVVEEGETYDGNGDTIIASGMGDGSQDENQDPIFKLRKGATLRNVRIAAPGCDGVHCYGNNIVENVVWEDVGEDALTVKDGESANSNTVTVISGSAHHADDKVFQINAPVTFIVRDFTATDMGKLIRQNGGTKFECLFYLYNVSVDGADECVARTDSSSTQLYYDENCSFNNVDTLWRFPSESQIHTINDSDTDDETPDETPDEDENGGRQPGCGDLIKNL